MRKWTRPLYERGIGTGQLSVLLARCEWDVDTAAKLLDMAPNEVAQFLAVLGYRLDDRGIWRKSQDQQGQLLQLAFDIAEQTQWLHREARDVEVKTLGRIVVKMHQETGKVPSVDEVKAARGAELRAVEGSPTPPCLIGFQGGTPTTACRPNDPAYHPSLPRITAAMTALSDFLQVAEDAVIEAEALMNDGP